MTQSVDDATTPILTDRRLTPATERVALESLRGLIARPAYTPGRPVRLQVPVADLCRAPSGARDRQLNFGAGLTLLDHQDDWAFVQAEADGYCGWLRADQIGHDLPPITHRVIAPATHVYAEPDLKSRDLLALSLGARLSVGAVQNGFARLAQGGWVPLQHLGDQPATDPAEVALSLLGTPYLWGGNSRWGIDCSGLAQAALSACAIACPGDSDMQEAAFPVAEGAIKRNDLLFWPGHVAMALDSERMIHATAYAMAVIVEPIAQAIARIDAAGQGPFRGARRPPSRPEAQFP
ncbi:MULTISPECIES: C40 family peptidase [unclassified Paracoccus (in: a-proteobacteria)]|uniref:C40 family peptidase n=1 Tax=unclassified Paracoccus (in: a-proteobacteria) TaxID=2688777 RepID=UPI0012B3AEE7|nr:MULTISPECIES: NlpC/P60 family protein [unclassified Paracoccus (in: a-proteobacteria)]UXU75837.1 C40 family peptidase [Paracoccus sp. SMMA_5]UXU81746.1 C40 family peptidase [Paracoccus sp. SMMA_5_TC]